MLIIYLVFVSLSFGIFVTITCQKEINFLRINLVVDPFIS